MAGDLYPIRKQQDPKEERYALQYCLYKVDETTIGCLGKPLFIMDQSTYPHPDRMSFVSVGAKIFMIGGVSYVEDRATPSSQTFVYDTLTAKFTQGPPLLSGKVLPLIFNVGSKIFALSRWFYTAVNNVKGFDPQPHFEMLDTDDPHGVWSALPLPFLGLSKRIMEKPLSVDSSCVSYLGDGNLGLILISLKDFGTYAFDLVKMKWNRVSVDQLPFNGKATPIPPPPGVPHATSLSLATSLRSKKYCAFQIHYSSSEVGELFRVDEIEIDYNPVDLCPPPSLFCESILTVVDPCGRIYFLRAGLDVPRSNCDGVEDIYVKVSALAFGQDKGKKLKLNPIWRRVLFGGPLCSEFDQISKAFII